MRPIDAEELLEHLEACLQNGRPLSNLYDLSEIVRYVKSMPTIAASPWHKCEDELPPANENLLCCGSRGGMFVGWVLGSAVCICGSCTGFVHGGKGRQFTHWMPLPEPPKEGA